MDKEGEKILIITECKTYKSDHICRTTCKNQRNCNVYGSRGQFNAAWMREMQDDLRRKRNGNN